MSQKHVEVLKLVLKYVKEDYESSGDSFICTSLHKVAQMNPEMWDTTDQLRNWVRKLLDGAYTLGIWLSIKGYNPKEHKKIWREKVHQTRIAWVEWMIQYWAAK